MSSGWADEGRGSGESGTRGEEWLDFGQDLLAVHVLTEDGIIAGTNRAFNEMFDADRTAFIGKHQAALNNYSVAANLRLLRDIRQQVDTAGSWRGFLTNRHPRGTEFTSRAHIYPVRYGSVRRLVCFQQPVDGAAPPRTPARRRRSAAHGVQGV